MKPKYVYVSCKFEVRNFVNQKHSISEKLLDFWTLFFNETSVLNLTPYMIFLNHEFDIILKRRKLEICKHSIF